MMIRTFAFCAAAALAAACGPTNAATLALPFKVPASTGKPRACDERVPGAVVSLAVTSRYDQTDATKSTIDEDAEEAYQEGMKPVRDFLGDVSLKATRYVESGGKKTDEAACALAWMAGWAKADALTDLDTRQAVLSSTRIVAGLAMSYIQVKDAKAGSPEDRAEIEAWFGRLGKLIRSHFTDGGDSRRTSDRQNHRYWAGFSLAAVGVATGSRADLDWAVNSYKIGACQIQADGTLPLELARGKRARDYHIHATAPLVMTAELAAANGIDAYALCDGAIHRLVRFDIAILKDAKIIEDMTGERQLKLPTKNGMIRGDRVAWLAPYLKRFPEARTALGTLRLPDRMTSSNLGGNLSVLFP